QAALDAGYDLNEILDRDRLVAGDDVFFAATGVTDGDVLQGVRYEGARGASTESLVMRSRSGTVRRVQARHDRTKLREITGERYGELGIGDWDSDPSLIPNPQSPDSTPPAVHAATPRPTARGPSLPAT